MDLLTEDEDEAERVRLLACVSNRRDGRYQLPGWPGSGDVEAAMLYAAARLTECLIVVRDNAMKRGGHGITGPNKRTLWLPILQRELPGFNGKAIGRMLEYMAVGHLESLLQSLKLRDQRLLAELTRGTASPIKFDREDDGE